MNYLCITSLIIATLSGSVYGQECRDTIISTNDEGTWISPNYPEQYDSYLVEECVLKYDEYNCNGIFITIDDLNLNGNEQDHLVLKTGNEQMEVGDEGRIFSYNITTESKREYLLHGDSIYMKFASFNVSDEKYRGFKLTYRCNGDVITTTESVTTEENPFPTANSTENLEVFIKPFTDDEFHRNISQFYNMLVDMAKEYCRNESIQLAPINDTIQPLIELVRQCSYTWPDYRHCVQVHFSIAVAQIDGNNIDYQLNSTNLNKMWKSLGEKYLIDSLGLSIYTPPDEESEYIVWVLVIFITMVVFLVYLVVIRVYGMKCAPGVVQKRRRSDLQDIIDQDDKNIPDGQLGQQHSLQTTPPLFDSDYTTYEPEKGLPASNYDVYATESDEDEILSLPGSAVPTSPRTQSFYFDNPSFESDL